MPRRIRVLRRPHKSVRPFQKLPSKLYSPSAGTPTNNSLTLRWLTWMQQVQPTRKTLSECRLKHLLPCMKRKNGRLMRREKREATPEQMKVTRVSGHGCQNYVPLVRKSRKSARALWDSRIRPMTSETRHLVQMADIRGLEIVCPN